MMHTPNLKAMALGFALLAACKPFFKKPAAPSAQKSGGLQSQACDLQKALNMTTVPALPVPENAQDLDFELKIGATQLACLKHYYIEEGQPLASYYLLRYQGSHNLPAKIQEGVISYEGKLWYQIQHHSQLPEFTALLGYKIDLFALACYKGQGKTLCGPIKQALLSDTAHSCSKEQLANYRTIVDHANKGRGELYEIIAQSLRKLCSDPVYTQQKMIAQVCNLGAQDATGILLNNSQLLEEIASPDKQQQRAAQSAAQGGLSLVDAPSLPLASLSQCQQQVLGDAEQSSALNLTAKSMDTDFETPEEADQYFMELMQGSKKRSKALYNSSILFAAGALVGVVASGLVLGAGAAIVIKNRKQIKAKLNQTSQALEANKVASEVDNPRGSDAGDLKKSASEIEAGKLAGDLEAPGGAAKAVSTKIEQRILKFGGLLAVVSAALLVSSAMLSDHQGSFFLSDDPRKREELVEFLNDNNWAVKEKLSELQNIKGVLRSL